jgi:predicted permease
MKKLREWILRLGGLFDKTRMDGELDEEIEAHLQLHIEDCLRSGLTPGEARRKALVRLGGIESMKEAYRDQRGLPWLEALWQDVRYGVRMLRKNPGFTFVAVFTLALGIGANAVVFSVGRTVLFRPLGFAGEDRLVWIQLVNTTTGAKENGVSWQDLDDIRNSVQGFESVATDSSPDAKWEDGDRSQNVSVVRATPNLAEALRLRPILGRLLEASDAKPNSEPAVLISDELWLSHFNRSPAVLGQSVRLDKTVRTIVGVLPSGISFPLERAPLTGNGNFARAGEKPFWVPMLKPRGEDGTSRGARMFLGVGRLKPGVSEASVREELAFLSKRLAIEHPESNRNWSFTVLSFRDQIFGRTRQGIPFLATAVAAVLLICCVNLANLLLARGVTRQRELAMRLALGAGRGRLVSALMMESVLLSILGGGAGIVLARGTLQIIHQLAANTVPFIHEARLDETTLIFTVSLSLLTALLFGLLPAVRHSRAQSAVTLRTGTRSSGGPQIRMWQQSLLAGQIAIVLVLLTSAGLLLESFRRLMGQELGYQPGSVITMDLDTGEFDSNGDTCRMYRRLRERLAVLPGVEAVGAISSAPLTGKWTFNERPNVVGQFVPPAERPLVAATFVAFDYFQAMRIPLVEGRYFRDGELNDDGYGRFVVLNEVAASTLFPGRSAVGDRFTVGSNPDSILEVIGVVKDTRDVRLEEKPQPRFYWQYAFGGAQMAIRSSAPAAVLMPLLREAVKQTDPRVKIDDMRTMTEIVASTVAERRFLMLMVTAYAVTALGIAALGVFGVVAYQVAQRTNEFGVRLALGATRGKLLRLVWWQAGRVVLMGLLAGLAISFATSRLMVSQLFGLTPHDPVLLTSVSMLLLCAAMLASLFPARRAAKVDPIVALRYE